MWTISIPGPSYTSLTLESMPARRVYSLEAKISAIFPLSHEKYNQGLEKFKQKISSLAFWFHHLRILTTRTAWIMDIHYYELGFNQAT